MVGTVGIVEKNRMGRKEVSHGEPARTEAAGLPRRGGVVQSEPVNLSEPEPEKNRMGRKVDYHALHNVNLPAIAASHGWRRDPAKSSQRVTVLRNDLGGKVIATIGHSGKWLWRNERNYSDHGDVLDFMAWIGVDRAELAISATSATTPSFPSGASSEPGTDRLRLERIWRCCVRETRNRNPWLDNRGIPPAVQAEFRESWRTGREGSCVFGYRNGQGDIVGLEVRGAGTKRFVAGSQRGLWSSANVDGALTIMLCESPLDCMAHFSLYGMEFDYLATGGAVSSLQLELLREKLSRPGLRIVAGFDNDEAGETYTALVRKSLGKIDRSRPIGKDWLDDLAFVQRENED